MKKLLVLLFLMVIGTSVYAQKSYVNVCADDVCNSNHNQRSIYLSGAIPSDMNNYYDDKYIGEIINMLAARGFVVEQMSCSEYTGNTREVVILSKTSSSHQTQIEGDVNQDGEVTISDVNKVINIILGIVRENPELLEKYGIVLPK